MRTWQELECLADRADYSFPMTRRLIAALKRLLADRTHEEIKYASNLIDENIDSYFDEMQRIEVEKIKEQMAWNHDLKDLFEWSYEDGRIDCRPTERTFEYIQEVSYLEVPENTERFDALLGYFFEYGIDDDDDEFLNGKEYEFMAVLALQHIDTALNGYDDEWLQDSVEDEKFPFSLKEWTRICRDGAGRDIVKAWHCLRLSELDFLSLAADKDKAILIQKAKREALSENASKAAARKKSPYEKAGTIAAVNELLREKKELLNQRGGKSLLNRMILDLITHGDIPAPNIPTQKTVDSWIDSFKNT